MKTKKLPAPAPAHARIEFKVKAKAEGSKDLFIEGFANKAVVDRGNELIPPAAWDVTDFKKNPIIFFNHDRNMPIGKATEVKVTKEGLRIKVKISNSDAAPMPYIRDMIEEGILCTFSVGFDDMDSAEKQDNGITLIKKAKLMETSVVTLPMNQDSVFDIAEKAMPSAADLKTKTYDEAVTKVLTAKSTKGSLMASQFHDRLANCELSVHEFDKEAALTALAAKAGMDRNAVNDILAGNVTPVPEEFLKAFSSVFMCSINWLKQDAGFEAEVLADEKEKAADPFMVAVKEAVAATADGDLTAEECVASAVSQVGAAGVTIRMLTVDETAMFVKQVEAIRDPASAQKDGVSIGTEATSDEGTPSDNLMKAQLALMGTLVTLTQDMLKEIRGLSSKMSDVFEIKAKEAGGTPPAPTPTPAPTPVEGEDAAKAARTQRGARLDRLAERLNTFEMTLARIAGQ